MGATDPLLTQLEEELQRLEESLRQTQAQFQQAQKMEAIGRLAGGVAHDFNNLLTIITGYSDLMLASMPPDDPNREMIAEIKTAGERAGMLTRQLLAFSRKQKVEPVVLDLNALIGNLDKMLRRLIGEDIHLTTVLRPGLHRVTADAGQIEQVLMNLVVNARDAMPRGGQITIETANVELDEGYAQTYPEVPPGSYVRMSVTDTGCGMDRETKAHLFEPFFTTKEAGKGTGLGLAIIYGIIKQSQGHITVYTEEGKGTTFMIYLPRVGGGRPPSTQVMQRAALPPGRGSILLVEDDGGVRRIARQTLEQNGFRVIEAANGEEALRLSNSYAEPIDLLVTDMVMPLVGGPELAKRLAPTRPALKVLYLSGYTDETVVGHGLLDPGLAFLQKPFAPDTLARKVHEVLSGVGPPRASL
jgi:nitrogen-specific signal transduction histidine kinase/ActR/RegA family two-component response regulator